MKITFSGIIQWLVFSSNNPTELSNTLEGIATVVLTYASLAIGILHINVGNADLNAIINSSVVVIQAAVMLFGAVWGFIGAIRKIALTLSGQNKVIAKLVAQAPKPIVAAAPAPAPQVAV